METRIKTQELIESYLGRDEYEYVETICEQMEKQFPGVLVKYRHLEKWQRHIWEFEFPGWKNPTSGIAQGILGLVRAIFEEVDYYGFQMSLTEQVITVTQGYEK